MDVNIDLVFCKTGFCVLLLRLKRSCLEFHVRLTFRHPHVAGGEEEAANNRIQIHVQLHENTESLPRKSVLRKKLLLSSLAVILLQERKLSY